MKEEILEKTGADKSEEKYVISEYEQPAFTVTPIDESVIENTINGDEDAFEALFMGTYRYVFAAVRKYLKNDQDAYDAIQDTYTKVYKNISHLESISSFYPWLHRIAENCAKDILNLNGRNSVLSQDARVAETADDDQSHNSDISADITEVLKQLPEDQAELLIRVYYDKMRVAEIARMQGVPATTVHNRLKAAKKKLKTLLKIRGIDKPIYGGEFISMISIALRNAIGTELLSMAVAEEILHNVIGSKNKKGAFVISRFARKERSRAALKIASILLIVCLLITAIALIAAGFIAKNFLREDTPDDKTTASSVSSTVNAPSITDDKESNPTSSLPSASQPAASSSKTSSSSSTTTSSKPKDGVKLLGSFITTEVFGTSAEVDNLNIATSGDTLYAVANGNLISLKKDKTSPTVLIKNFASLYGNDGKCLNVYNKKVYWVNKNSDNKFVLNRCNIDGTGHYSVIFKEFDCTYLTKMIVAKDGIYFTAGIHGNIEHQESGVLYKTDYNFNIQKQLSGVANYTLMKDKIYYLYGQGNVGLPFSADRATFENQTAVPIESVHVVSYSNIHSFGDYVIFQGYSPYRHSEYRRSDDIKILDTVSGKLVRFIYAEADNNYDIIDVSDYGGGTILYKHFGNTKMFNVKTGENKIISYSDGTIFGNYRYYFKSNSLCRSGIDGKSAKKIY